MNIPMSAKLFFAAAFLASAWSNASQAADVYRQVHTPSGSDVTLYKDGSGVLINQVNRWNFHGQWKKEGGKDCVNWIGRTALKQCY